MITNRTKPRLGVLTLGQTPRIDVVPAIEGIVGERIEVIQEGLLDALGPDEIAALAPNGDEPAFVSRLRDGSSVTMSAERLEALLPEAGRRLSSAADAILLLCSGSYPEFDWTARPIFPDRVIAGALTALTSASTVVGVISPLATQTAAVEQKWTSVPGHFVGETASPYDDLELLLAATRRLLDHKPDVILLDCMGFGPRHRNAIRELTATPVVVPTTLVAHIINEVFS